MFTSCLNPTLSLSNTHPPNSNHALQSVPTLHNLVYNLNILYVKEYIHQLF